MSPWAWGRLVAAALALGGLVASAAAAEPRNAVSRSLEGLWTNVSATPLERPKGATGLSVDAAGEAALLQTIARANAEDDASGVGGGDSEWWERGTRLQRIGGQARTSIIIDPADGRLPWSAAGKAAVTEGLADNFDDPERRPLSEQCLGGSSSRVPMLPHKSASLYRFVQTKTDLAIWMEAGRGARIIPIGPASHPASHLPLWNGDSVGHWEGRTLVVDTIDFSSRAAIRWPYQLMVGPQARVTERFTRIDKDQILYQFTVEDLVDYSQPWRGELIFRTTPGPIFEYACHEGNYSLPGVLAGARRAEAGGH
jgi:hypothetical protein